MLQVATIGSVLLLLLWLFDAWVPRAGHAVTGTVTMFETHANKSGVWYSVNVHLDTGLTVRGSNPFHLTTPVGSRVELWEAVGSVSGIKRYRLQRLLPARSDDHGEPGWHSSGS